MRVYLDSDFRCHLTDDGTMCSADVDFFDGKCKEFIEGYRFIPFGKSWTRSDGAIFYGQMIAPVEDYDRLEKAQRQYEADESSHLADLGIPQEQSFTATRNYPAGGFVGIYGQLYEVIRAIPIHSSILNKQNVIGTTVEHYLDTLKEK